jgi:thiamine-phosphate pyrophosphorylase
VAASRDLTIVIEARSTAARVHNINELTRARLRRTPLILVSPIFATRSHPDWKPLPRMRAAALAQLANRRAIALGGMDEKGFGRVRRLGFVGWAGISAWRKVIKVTE